MSDSACHLTLIVSSQGPKGDLGLPGLPGPPGLPGIKGDRVRMSLPTTFLRTSWTDFCNLKMISLNCSQPFFIIILFPGELIKSSAPVENVFQSGSLIGACNSQEIFFHDLCAICIGSSDSEYEIQTTKFFRYQASCC